MEFHKDGYVFEFNELQGIINIEDAQGELVDCLVFGPGYKIPELDFREKCIEWLEAR